MDGSALFSIMTATTINSAMPGPCMILIATRAALSGRSSGLRTSLGVAAAQLTYVVMALVLLAFAWGISEVAHSAMRLAGAVVLVVLGVRMFSASGGNVEPGAVSSRRGSDFLIGLCVGFSSPYNLIFMFAILPQFLASGVLPARDVSVLLAGIFLATMGPMCATAWLGAGTGKISRRFVPIITRTGAVALMVFAGISIASMA